MLDQEIPEEVRKLRPRKLRLGQDAERLLAHACGAEGNPNPSRQRRGLRPKADSINAIRCADCGQVEYLTREYCRCGHYLVGQLQDEYLAWEQDLLETQERLSAAADRCLRPFRLAMLAGLPFVALPPLYVGFSGAPSSVDVWLWMLPGLALFGLGGLAEARAVAKRGVVTKTIANATFEQFLNER